MVGTRAGGSIWEGSGRTAPGALRADTRKAPETVRGELVASFWGKNKQRLRRQKVAQLHVQRNQLLVFICLFSAPLGKTAIQTSLANKHT